MNIKENLITKYNHPYFQVITEEEENKENSHVQVIWDNHSSIKDIPRIKVMWDNISPKKIRIFIDGEEMLEKP
ncbi:MAG: hypothetical protein ACFFAS_10875 [Promethearchaeota archaeon]